MPLSAILSESTLDKVMHLFWEKGFAATSIGDVVKLTRLSRAAIYKHFGSKEKLYAAMLKRYFDEVTSELVLPLLQPDLDPLSALKQFFHQFTESMHIPMQQKGCFLVVSATDLSLNNEAAKTIINEFLNQLQKRFYILLSDATNQGMCKPKLNCQEMTSFLIGNIMGVMTLLRAQAPKRLVDEHIQVVERYLETLKTSESICKK